MKINQTALILVVIGVIALFSAGCSIPSFKSVGEEAKNDVSQKSGQVDVNLDLSGRNLDKLDMSIFERSELESLNISKNNLSNALPSQIGNLKKLKVLNASNNNFTGIPSEIGKLSQLEMLDFSNNSLTGLPNELSELKNLKTFNLSGNKISQQDLDVIRKNLTETEFIVD